MPALPSATGALNMVQSLSASAPPVQANVTQNMEALSVPKPDQKRPPRHSERGEFSSTLFTATEAIHTEVESGNRVNAIIAGAIDPVKQELVDEKKITTDEFERRKDQYRRAYVASLHASYGFERALEILLDESPEGLATYKLLGLTPSTPKVSELIKKDLAFFGEVPSEVLPEFPHMLSHEERIGAMYVRAGSRNGGRVIAHHVKKALGLDENTGASFYSSLGTHSIQEFRSFCKGVDQYSDRRDNIQIGCASAISVFQIVSKWQIQVYNQHSPGLLHIDSSEQSAPPKSLLARVVGFFVRED